MNPLKPLITILLLLATYSSIGQVYYDSIPFYPNKKAASKAQLICKYGDSTRMEATPNGWMFKQGLEDASYTAFYDKECTDTAITVTIENGKMNGVFMKWLDGIQGPVIIAQYKNGFLHGYWIKYFYHPEGQVYKNIWIYERNVPVEEILTEW